MRDDFHVGQCWPAQPREALGQRSGRVEWRAWKWPEAGDKDGNSHLNAEEPRDFFNRKRRRKLAGGDLSLCLSQLGAH